MCRSSRVEDAAIIPVTAFGFGNAMQRKLRPHEDNRNDDTADHPFSDEPVWLLKDGAVMEPHNLSTLVLWTLLFGLLNQSVKDESDGAAEIAEVCRMLQEDLHSDEHWLAPIKGRLVQK